MEENLSLRFGFWPSLILLTDHYVLVSTLSKNSSPSMLASPETAGGSFLIPARLEYALLSPDLIVLEFHKYFRFPFSSYMLQM